MCDEELALAYIAGFIDGEGSISIYKEKSPLRYRIEVTVGNTFKPVLEGLFQRFGGRVRPYNTYKPNYRQAWYWGVSGETAYKFLTTILPYLREKAVQAQEVIAFYELYGGQANKGRLVNGTYVNRTPEQLADQEERYLRVRALKKIEYAA